MQIARALSLCCCDDCCTCSCGAGIVPDADGKGIGLLVQTAMVQLHAAVVQVHTVDQLIVRPILCFSLQTHAAALKMTAFFVEH